MRIRKRFPPSSLSSVPLSDPQLISPSLLVQTHVQAHVHGNLCVQEEVTSCPDQSDPQNQPLQQPAVQEMMIGTENPILACPLDSIQVQMKQKEIEGKEIKDERWKAEEEKKRSNDIRQERTSSGEVNTQLPQSSSSSSSCQALDRWGEGDRVVPLKKRKGSFERMGSKEMIKPKMKSKTNKKCLQQNGRDVRDEKRVADTESVAMNTASSAKKAKRGSVIMEGSRCSRVNGRGWRCCQQTLVGYSLCEHHLGKGRLRSMTSVRNRPSVDNTTSAAQDQHKDSGTAARLTLASPSEKQSLVMKSSSTNNPISDVAHDEEDERKPLMSRKKRMKIGAVKARSISSLLGQTDNADGAAANRNKNSSTS